MPTRKADTDIDTKPVVLGICAHVTLFLLFSKCLIDVGAMCVIMYIYHIRAIYICVCVYLYTHVCYNVCGSSKLFLGVTKYTRNICSQM